MKTITIRKPSIKITLLLLLGLFAISVWAQQQPILGNYPNISMGTSQVESVIPSSPPRNFGVVTVVSENFPGDLSVDAISGVVTVSSTEQIGTFNVQVRAYDRDNNLNYYSSNFRIVVFNTPTIPSYAATAINLGDNTIIAPTVQPQFIVQSAAVSAGFLGDLSVDSTTGTITVTNAKPAGVFTVTYWGFLSNGNSVNSTFQLTVNEISECSSAFLKKTGVTLPYSDKGYTSVGDFNNDNIQDIITIVDANFGVRVLPLLGDGLGNFTATNTINQPAFGSSFSFSNVVAVLSNDFNRDGNLDVAVSAGNKIMIGFGDGNGNIIGDPEGSLPASQIISISGRFTDMVMGHFNDDGLVDIMASSSDGLGNNGNVRVYYGDQDGGFTTSNTRLAISGRYPKGLHSGNFNTDVLSEVFIIYSNGTTGAWRVNSVGDYVSIITPNSSNVKALITDDLDDNGAFDIAVVTSDGLDIYLNNNFTQPSQSITLDTAYNDVQTVNFNGDGFLDLLISSTQDDKITALLGDGAGSFTEDISVEVRDPKSVIVGEFNGDGKQDFVVNNNGTSVFLAGDDGIALNNFGGTSTKLGSNGLVYIRVENTGDNDLVIDNTSITIDGTDEALFTVIGHTSTTGNLSGFSPVFPLIVNPGPRQIKKYVVVLFEPEAVGNFTANLNIAKGDCDNPITSFVMTQNCFSNFNGVLGQYQDTTVFSGENISLNSTGGVFEFDKLVVTTDSNFDGILSASSIDGELRVTNPIKAGVYTVKISGFEESDPYVTFDPLEGIGSETSLSSLASTTFQLTVVDPICSSGAFEVASTIVEDEVSDLTALAIGDFNLDGKQDLLTTYSNNTLPDFADVFPAINPETLEGFYSSFMKLGDGSGDFGLGNTFNKYMVGLDPRGIHIDDFNGDGLHDIVVANSDLIGNTFTRVSNGFLQFEFPFKLPPAGNLQINNGNIITPVGAAYSKEVAFGDFNNDGIKDLAIVSEGVVAPLIGTVIVPSTVSIQFGDGLGGNTDPQVNNFTQSEIIFVGNKSVSIVAGDFNSDGIQDFATASAGEHKISVRMGTPNDNIFKDLMGYVFDEKPDVPVSLRPSSMVIGDFNNDGKQDFAVACRGNSLPDGTFLENGLVSIRLGDGNGGFSAFTNSEIEVGLNPSSIKIGDFNGDGIQDFAVTNTFGNDVSIRFGSGDGTFYGASQIEVGEAPVKLVVGDFNADHVQDLAVANRDGISILIGKPYSAQQFVVKGNDVVIENNDNTPDAIDHTDFEYVAVNGGTISRTFSIENNGESALTLETGAIAIDGAASDVFSLSDISYPIFIPSGESFSFNVDFEPTSEGEKTALISVNVTNCEQTTSYNFSVKGTMIRPPALGTYPDTELELWSNSSILPDAVPLNTLKTVAYADSSFKGTLLVDPISGELSVTNASEPGMYTVTVIAFTLGDISTMTTFMLTVSNSEQCLKTFSAIDDATFNNTGAGPTAITIGDFNNDGNQDVVNANENSNFLTLKFGDGNASFSSDSTIPVPVNTTALAVGDINGDGYLDIVATNGTDGELYVILGNGDGTFQPNIVISITAESGSIALGDLNNDGLIDLALSNELEGKVYTFLGDGTGNFESDTVQSISAAPKQVILGDFNSDDNLDMATANYDTNSVAIILGNGDGSFAPPSQVLVGQGPTSLTIGDFNNDNIQDIVTTNNDSFTILAGDGTGNFTTVSELSGTGTATIKVGEFNGDGIQDIISKPLSSDQLKVYTGNGSGTFSEFYNIITGSNMSSLAIGDFNSDGLADVVLTSVDLEFIALLIGEGPEISISGSNSAIVDGETNTSLSNGTDFGRVQIGESIEKTFLMKNLGNAILDIPAEGIYLTGDNGNFLISPSPIPAVSLQPNSQIGIGFSVRFTPGSEGVKEATVHILSSDCKTPELSFKIEGEGAAFSMPNYPATFSVASGNNLTIMPEANDVPVNIVSATAYVDYSSSVDSPHFEGSFTVDPQTGVINVINAKPEGVYTVKIIGLQNLSTADKQTKTITLTVNPPICSDGTFRSVQDELNGGRSAAIVEGDFNGDAIIDVVSHIFGNFVKINLGNADGTFQNPQVLAVGSIGIRGISVSDFNGDGHQDILSRATGIMYLNLGAGDGSFGTSLDFSINNTFRTHAVGDFNNDGKQDIVLRNYNTVACLTGNGDGTFNTLTRPHDYSSPRELKAGDFNKDGNLDFIVFEEYGGIQFHSGLGNGLFDHNRDNDIDIDGLSTYYTMGDFNNDAIIDIAVNSLDYDAATPPETGSFKIYFGDENANFSAGPAIAADYGSIRGLNVGDFNGDSNLDILVNNETVFLGEGDGTFPVIPVLGSSRASSEYQTVIGDFNKDGKQDYVSVSNDFEVFLGVGRLAVFSANAAAGDVYLNDGATNSSEQSNTVFETCINTTQSRTYILENKGTSPLNIDNIFITGDVTNAFILDAGTLPLVIDPNTSTSFTIRFEPTNANLISAAVHIQNNDCNDQNFDFVIEGQGIVPQSQPSVGIYAAASMQSGDNITVQPNSAASGTALSVRAYTDSNFKGVLSVNPISGDVMITNAYPAGTYQITVEALGVCTSASSTFELVVGNPACSTALFERIAVFEYDSRERDEEVYVADFNEDGIQDVVISGGTPNPKMRIQLGNADGSFTLQNEIVFEGAPFNDAYLDLAIGDFNGDGHIDITATANRRLTMYLGDGAGNFNIASVLLVDNLTGQFAIAEDFNNDGKLDILVKEENTTTDETKLAIFLGNGADGFSLKRDIFIDASQVSVGDFNHDGNKDLVVASLNASLNGDRVYVLSGDGLAGFTETTTLLVDRPAGLVLSDFNNDGEQDIAVTAFDLVPNPDLSSVITMMTANQRVELYNGSSSGLFSSTPSSVLPLVDDPNYILDFGREIRAGDFNADGNPDLVVAYFGALPGLPLLLGNGSGSFAQFAYDPLDFNVENLTIGDFNSDGRQDIITTTLFGSETINIFYGAGAKIALKGNENLIEDGSTIPVSLNATDFGETCPTGSIVKTFTIENQGYSDLVLDAGAISSSGADADQFAIGDIELPVTIAANSATTFTVTFNPNALGVATTTINIASSDCSSSGFSFSIGATVTTEEFEPPIIDCPIIETVYYANANSCYTSIPLVVTATDNCTLEPTLTSNTPLNNQFPVGETTVVYTATDDNGNTATCEFVITVVDNIAPSLICTESITIAYGESLDPEDIGRPELVDNCFIENVSLTYTESTTQSNAGCGLNNYTIARFWTATDASGNSDLCLQVINVVDKTGPTVILQDITVPLDASGAASVTAEAIDNGSNDNCGVDSMVLDTMNFDCSNIGDNTVTLSVTDTNGNVSTATAIVTVVDDILPEAISQDITVFLDASGNASITPDQIDNGSNDACGIASLALDITTFNTNDAGENVVQLTVTDTNGNVSVITAIVTVDASLGIGETALDLGLSVYPNPTPGSLNLKITNFNKGDLSYQLYSLHGQLLLSETVKGTLTPIPMHRLSEGMYLLKVNLNNKEIKSYKIIKKE